MKKVEDVFPVSAGNGELPENGGKSPALKIYSIIKEERRPRVPLRFERTVLRRMDVVMARRAIYGKPEDASGN